MNLTLISALGGLLLSVAAFFYGQHVANTACQADKEAMQLDASKKEASFKAAVSGVQDVANAHEQGVVYDYQKRVQALAAANADASDSLKRMRDAIAIYAAKPNPAGLPQSSSVPVSPPDPRVIELGSLAGSLAIGGAEPSQDAASCAVKLRAAEAWAATVIGEQK
jgi:hypothetical protein